MDRINKITEIVGMPISVRQGKQSEFYLSTENKYDNWTIYFVALSKKDEFGIAYCRLTDDHVLVVFNK